MAVDHSYVSKKAWLAVHIAIILFVEAAVIVFVQFVLDNDEPTPKAGRPAQTSPQTPPETQLRTPPTQPIGAVTVAQLRKDTSTPVGFFSYTKDYQKAAQTFTAPSDSVLTAIAPFLAYHLGDPGELAYVRVFALRHPRDSPDEGRTLRVLKIDLFSVPRESFAHIPIRPPIPLKKGLAYGFQIEVRRPTTELGVGLLSYKNPYPGGLAWYYTRTLGGNAAIIDNRHDWHSYNDDLAFAVTLVPLSGETD